VCETCGRNIVLEVPTTAVYSGDSTRLHFAGTGEHHVYLADSREAHGYAVLSRGPAGLGFARIDAADEAAGAKVARATALRDDHPVVLGKLLRVGGSLDSPVVVIEAIATYEAVSRAELLDRALMSVNELLEEAPYSQWVHEAKAKGKRQLDPTNPDDWAVIVANIQAKVTKTAGRMSAEAVQSMIDGLDIDWTQAGDEELKQLSEKMNKTMAAAAVASWAVTYTLLSATVASVLKTTSENIASKYGFTIGTSISQPDLQAAQRLSMDRGIYYFREQAGGPLSESITKKGREIVERGIKEGWGREDIVKKMRDELGKEADRLTTEYLRMSIDAQVARAREYSSLVTMSNAGIEWYEVEEVMDSVTCDACRFMHGKKLSVEGALKRYEAANKLADPRDIKYEMPWIRQRTVRGGENDGKPELFIVQKDGSEKRIAIVDRSGMGKDDDQGEYSSGLSADQLEAMEMGPPPYHGHCRGTTIPVVPEVPGVTNPS
jgi:SPP1 gp7 family putative phage head morphogenesis protein